MHNIGFEHIHKKSRQELIDHVIAVGNPEQLEKMINNKEMYGKDLELYIFARLIDEENNPHVEITRVLAKKYQDNFKALSGDHLKILEKL